MVPQETKLLSTLSNNDVTFFIPPYQRNYEWTEEQCEVFLDDVIKTHDSNTSGVITEHFFGTITYFQTDTVFGQPNKLVLIDGQQRITTTMLFLVALRDILGDASIGQFIDYKYLKNNNVAGDSEYKVKLKQVETDWDAYKNIILRRELSDNDRHTAVYRNYMYFFNRLSEFQSDGYDLSALIEKGLSKFSVITIELQPEKNPWENPQEIFESMNSLGKPLSLADLVRNYLLLGLNADTQTYLYDQYWLHIERVLPGKVSSFIRDYMQAHEGRSYYKASESHYKDLYGEFKKIFGDSDAQELLKDLSECASIYSYCIGDAPTGSDRIDRYLADLNRMSVTTSYSFLMVLLRAWKHGQLTEQSVIDILDAFRIYCLRRRLIGATTAENKNFPQYVKWMGDLTAALDKKQRMFELLARQESNLRLPNDIEIKRFMSTMNFYNFGYCKFYLALVEEAMTKGRPDLGDKLLQTEHIMPRNLSDAWRAALGEDCDVMHQELVDTIGNLTLIRHNQELGNKPFAEKKAVYESAEGLQIARAFIQNESVWDGNAIRNRTDWISDYMLLNVFPIPKAMRQINNYIPKEGRALSFQNLQLIGLEIEFIDDPSYRAKVVGDKEVEFEGKKWRLSPLTQEIQKRRGKETKSGAYQGARFWAYDGLRLSDII